MKQIVIGMLGGALLLASQRSEAQTPGVSRSTRAAALYREGQSLLNSGRVAAACAKFEASESLQDDFHTLFTLGDCQKLAGRNASAWRAFSKAERLALGKRDAEHAQLAAERVAALEPRLTRIACVVPMTSRVPGLTVRLGKDIVPPNQWGTLLAVDSGVQRVSATAEGYDSWSVELDAEGEGHRYRVDVPPLARAERTERAAARGDAYRTAGVVTGGVGLAGIGAGAVFSALSRNAESTSTCVKGVVQCTPSKSNSSIYTDAATVSFALGGALVATGVTLFVLAPSPDKQEKNALRLAARYAGGGGRLQLEGVW